MFIKEQKWSSHKINLSEVILTGKFIEHAVKKTETGKNFNMFFVSFNRQPSLIFFFEGQDFRLEI